MKTDECLRTGIAKEHCFIYLSGSGRSSDIEWENICHDSILDWLNFRKSTQITPISSEDSDFVQTWRKEQKKFGVPP